MTNNKSNFYVTTAIDYASGSPHIGHAYEKIGADVIARWNRKIGNETFFLTGTDEHGLKIVEKAKEKNLNPKEFVEIESLKFIELTKILNLSNDFFIRTTNQKHKNFVQKMLQKSFDNGDIYLAEYEGLYCIGCEKYYSSSDLIQEDKCPIHLKSVKKVKEENYFFKLSKYQEKLLNLYEKNPDFISPKHRKNEILNRIKEGLQDISISRPKSSLNWGIEFPFDNSHVTYVWFDALFNYISALDLNQKNQFWPADIHIIGKDIMWFHMVYWPAFLFSTDFKIPKKIFAHGMILDENSHKMSKSLGNVIDPFEQINKFGLDEFRYYLLALGSFGEDINYSQKGFIEKINNDLNNDFGNLVSRVHAMIGKYFNGILPELQELSIEDKNQLENLNIFSSVNSSIQELEFCKALDKIFTSIRETNAYVNKVAPWKISDKKRLGTILNILTKSVLILGEYLEPFIPEKIKLLKKQFNFEIEINLRKDLILPKSLKLNEKINLFSKINLDKEINKSINNEEKREGFALLNLKIGKILSVKQHPQAEKLYIEEIDLGEEKPRQIVSGLKDHYTKEQLIGKKVIVVANLKPAKLRGEISQGMVLLAESKDGKKLALLGSKAPIGTNLKSNNIIADNPSMIKIETFFQHQLISLGKKIVYNNFEVNCGEFNIEIENNIEGLVR